MARRKTTDPDAQGDAGEADLPDAPRTIEAAEVVLELPPGEPPADGDDRPAPTAEPGPARRRTWPWLLTGGLIGASALFGAAGLLDGRWPFLTADRTATLAAAIDAQAETIAGLQTRIAALEVPRPSVDPAAIEALADRSTAIETGLDGLTSRIDALEATGADLDTRLAEIAGRPAAGADNAEAVAAYEAELAAMRSMFQQELDAIRTETASAIQARAAAGRTVENSQAALTLLQLEAAVNEGRSFAELLSTFDAEIPSALRDQAATGVPTLAALRTDFAEPARAAVAADIRAEAEAGRMNRFIAFLQTQLGARSLTPRAGDDADAVLSRAEDALRHGQLDEAVATLSELPPAAAAPMAGWLEAAGARQAALAALAALHDEMGG